MKKVITVFLLGICAVWFEVPAQIIITPLNTPFAGDTNIYGVDTILYPGFSSGQAGANKIYDYSNLAVHLYDTVRYIDPLQTPFGGDYPLANLARYDQDDTSIIYWKVDSSQIVDVGVVDDTYSTGNFLAYHFDPFRLNITYPSTYNTYHPNNVSIYDIVVAGSSVNQPYDSLRRKLTDNRTIIFDGWGTLILASGSYPCLRESRQDAYIDSVWYKNGGGSWTLLKHTSKSRFTIRYYTNISNDPMMRIKYDDNLQVIAAYFLINPSLFTGISANDQSIKVSVFPNPVSYELFVLHDAADGSQLSIYDESGKCILQVELETQAQVISCSSIKAGNYFFNITAKSGKILYNDKIIIIK